MEIDGTKLNETLSTALATQPYPIDLRFDCSSYSGIFIDHLVSRQTLFGALRLDSVRIEDDDLSRICQRLDLFDKLQLPNIPKDFVLKVLSAPLQYISFGLGSDGVKEIDISDIAPKEIHLDTFYCNEFPTTFISSFLHRVARLGHLEGLGLRSLYPVPGEVVKDLIRAVAGNEKLKYLTLKSYTNQWGPYIEDLFSSIEEHKSLRTFNIDQYPKDLDPSFSWLKKLLKRNRNIKVVDIRDNEKWANENGEINQIYAFTRFCTNSETLYPESASILPSLVGTTLTQCAASNFSYATLLLTHHTDMLCQLLQNAVDSSEPSTVLSNSIRNDLAEAAEVVDN